MADPNGETLPVTDPTAQLLALLQGLGGVQSTSTTSNTGDVSGLQTAMAGTQAFDPTALLQAIFQQAGGAIPGIQQAYGNAIGARSGGNSAVKASLDKLMSQVALAGQQQVVDQQQKNLALQGQIGQGLAQATQQTTKKATDQAPNIGNAAQNLLLMQGIAKLADTSLGKSLIGQPPTSKPAAQTQQAQVDPLAFLNSTFANDVTVQQAQPDMLSGLEQYVTPETMYPDFAGLGDYSGGMEADPLEFLNDYTY